MERNRWPSSSPNPNPSSASRKPNRVARRFLRAVLRINGSSASLLPLTMTTPSLFRQSQRIRRAAFVSMARAARPRARWSRALLLRLRLSRRPPARSRLFFLTSPASRSYRGRNLRHVVVQPPRQAEPARTEDLRRLVPGGTGMDFCSLLEETADYVRCLKMQVHLMRSIVDST